MRKRVMIAVLVGVSALAGSASAAQHRAPAVSQAAARADWAQTFVRTPEGGVRMGNPNATVKLVEYGSRTCPHCAHFAADGVPALRKSYIANGSVSYEFRDYPIHGALDMGPILLGKCVAVSRFFALLDLMMANQQTLIGRTAPIPAADQVRLAKASPNEVAAYTANFYGYTDLVTKRGLPAATAKACLADRKAIEAVARQADDAARLYGVNSTPTFIINGKVALAASDWAALEPMLRAAGAR